MSAEQYYAICTVDDPPRGGVDLFDLEAAAEYSGMHPEMIREFGRAHLVRIAHLSKRASLYFDREGLGRLRQIEQLRLQRGANLHTIRFVIRLLDRLEAAESELEAMRPEIR